MKTSKAIKVLRAEIEAIEDPKTLLTKVYNLKPEDVIHLCDSDAFVTKVALTIKKNRKLTRKIQREGDRKHATV